MLYRSSYNALAQNALQMREARYHVRPKQHQLEHLVYDYLPRNARHMANYGNEDSIRRTKVQALKAHPLYMPQQVLSRYAMSACLKWTAEG